MIFSPVLHEASQPGRELKIQHQRFLLKVVVLKMAQSVECFNQGFFSILAHLLRVTQSCVPLYHLKAKRIIYR